MNNSYLYIPRYYLLTHSNLYSNSNSNQDNIPIMVGGGSANNNNPFQPFDNNPELQPRVQRPMKERDAPVQFHVHGMPKPVQQFAQVGNPMANPYIPGGQFATLHTQPWVSGQQNAPITYVKRNQVFIGNPHENRGVLVDEINQDINPLRGNPAEYIKVLRNREDFKNLILNAFKGRNNTGCIKTGCDHHILNKIWFEPGTHKQVEFNVATNLFISDRKFSIYRTCYPIKPTTSGQITCEKGSHKCHIRHYQLSQDPEHEVTKRSFKQDEYYKKVANNILKPGRCPNHVMHFETFVCDKCDTLTLLTEGTTYNILEWCRSSTIQADKGYQRQTTNGTRTELEWAVMLFQLYFGLLSLYQQNIYIEGFDYRNIYMTSTKNNKYWLYKFDNVDYYVPNTGFVLQIDACCEISTDTVQTIHLEHSNAVVFQKQMKTVFKDLLDIIRNHNEFADPSPNVIDNIFRKIQDTDESFSSTLIKYVGKHFLHNRLGKKLNQQEVASTDMKMGEQLVAPRNGCYVSLAKNGYSYNYLGVYCNGQLYYTTEKNNNDDPLFGNDIEKSKVENITFNSSIHRIIHIDNIPQEPKMFSGHHATCIYDFGSYFLDQFSLPGI